MKIPSYQVMRTKDIRKYITSIEVYNGYIGESIEYKIERIVTQKEPITDGAPQIYTDRRDGVLAEYDIRTDRFEIAIEAMDKVSKSHMAKREKKAGEVGKPETTQATIETKE